MRIICHKSKIKKRKRLIYIAIYWKWESDMSEEAVVFIIIWGMICITVLCICYFSSKSDDATRKLLHELIEMCEKEK